MALVQNRLNDKNVYSIIQIKQKPKTMYVPVYIVLYLVCHRGKLQCCTCAKQESCPKEDYGIVRLLLQKSSRYGGGENYGE